jgi:serine/threonine protein kinase
MDLEKVDRKDWENIQREINLHQKLQHESIIKFYSYEMVF